MNGDSLPVQPIDEVPTPMRALFQGVKQAVDFARGLRDQNPQWPCARGTPHWFTFINFDVRVRGEGDIDWEVQHYKIAACMNCHHPDLTTVEYLLASLDQKTEYDRAVWAEYKQWKEGLG